MIQRVRSYLFQVFFAFVAFSISSAFAGENPFTIDDYFKLRCVSALALSSDGEMIAYAVESASLAENKTIRTVFVSATAPGAKRKRIDSIQKARDFAWIPGTHELAYLLNVDDGAQIFSIDPKTKKTRKFTNGSTSVTAFRFAPDGSALAWTTQQSNGKSSTLYERLFHGDKGVVIDSEYAVVYQFVNPEWPDIASRPPNELWVKEIPAGKARRVETPGKVKSFYWSSDAKMLSISYVADDVPIVAVSETYTSLGVYDAAAGTFRPIAEARTPSKKEGSSYYSGGEWIPGKSELIIRRTKEHDLWSRKTEWSIFDLSSDSLASLDMSAWRPIEMYGVDLEPAFLPVNDGLIYSERTVRAHKSLYEIAPSGLRRAEIFKDIAGAISHVRFRADFNAAAFVNEDFNRPPEIYLWRTGHGATQLTHLNKAVAAKQLPRVKEVHWRSKDGVSVQGWLLEPADDNGKPWPLITHVNGGPGYALPNRFAAHFFMWPYPFEVYALNSMAVFVPAYRGTGTFGYDFKHPSALDKEPVDDIISGIDYLVAERIAVPARLAISGHSHGAWLASLVMTRAKYFRAASIAEGSLNKTALYNLTPGWLNRDVHDIQYGASLYDDPARYVELSPDMHFKGLDTAVLFEAGAKASAINMMGAPKAASRAGMPSEFVVYPKTGHGMQIPRLQKESAQRNVDWFRYWLQDYEDPDPEKGEQYVRWRTMRDEQCARPNGQDNAPWYCRH